MDFLVKILPHVNASLNGLAAVLLVVGFILIKRGKSYEAAHKWTMLSCFGVSVVFLICYLFYHYALHSTTGEAGRKFPQYPAVAIRYSYFFILLTHIVLAAAVPFLAVATIVFGLRDNRKLHRKFAKVTFPIWLYVSITGVIVYAMLYHLFPPRDIIEPAASQSVIHVQRAAI
ncbi:MAG: putative membrane protein [Pirellulaceae bacterium]|jgi:putative membrane protein